MAEQFGDLNDLRIEITNRLLTNQDLLKFLYYQDSNIDILNQPILTRDQRKKVADEQIFKYFKVDTTLSNEIKCYISFDIKETECDTWGNFYKPIFTFNIVCGYSLIETQNGSRILALEECLKRTFHNWSHECIIGGTVKKVGSGIIPLQSPYCGRFINFKTLDMLGK